VTYASLMASLNPLAWYRLGEASGTVMHDASGNGRDGTYTGVTLAAGGALGTGGDSDTAVTTTGSAASVGSVPYASWMNGFTGFSVVGWVKFTTTGTAFFFSRTGNTAYNYGLFVAGKKLSMGVRASGSNAATGATDSNDGAWHFAVGTWDGTTIRIYRDGALDGSQALSGTLVTQLNDLQLGGRAANYIAASMDEVAIFGTVLSATDVARLYAAATTAPAVTTLAGTIGAVTGAFSVGLSTNDVALVGAIPAVTGTFSLLVGAAATPVTLDGQIPAVTGAFTVGFVGNVSLAGGIPAVTGSAALTPVPLSQWATAVRALGADVLWWARLNDGDGSATLWDASGNGHHGTYSEPWTVQPAVVGDGASVTFEQGSVGSSGHADVPTTGWLDAANGPDEFTLLVWAYRGPSTGGDLFDSDHDLDAVINLVSGPDTDAKIQTTTGSYSITEHLVPTGPALLAITYEVDTVNGYKLWRNAVQRAALNTTGGAVPDWSNATLRLGSASFTTDAPMDEALIVGRALSGAEITALYLAGLAADASLAGNIPAVTGAFTVLTPLDVSLAGTVRAVTGAFTVLTPREVSLAGSVPAVTGAFTMTAVTPVTLAGTIGAVTGSFTLPTGEVSLAGVQQNVQGSFAIAREQGLVLAGTIGPVTGVFALTGSYQVTLTGAIPAVTSSFLLTFPPQTDTGNRASGRTRLGAGYVFYEPPVVEPPDFSVASTPSSRRAPTPAVNDGPAVSRSSRSRRSSKRARDRVVVGGRDVTYFRGVTTPAPSYTLVVPLLYGSGRSTLPAGRRRVRAPRCRRARVGAKGKKVLVQRVDPDTTRSSPPTTRASSSPTTSPAATSSARDRRRGHRPRGADRQAAAAVLQAQRPRLLVVGRHPGPRPRFEPRLGPDTGIVLRNAGGMDHLDYMHDLSAKGTRRNGAQLTCMPDSREDGGAYRVVEKDLETSPATVYLDDTVSVPDVRDDMAEQPNRVFATGVTPPGCGSSSAPTRCCATTTPPPYPMTDGSHFGVGTTDGDTDTGDGVSVMIWRLVKAGYLALADKPGGFDSEVADAIRDLKTDALSGHSDLDRRRHDPGGVGGAVRRLGHRLLPGGHADPPGGAAVGDPEVEPHLQRLGHRPQRRLRPVRDPGRHHHRRRRRDDPQADPRLRPRRAHPRRREPLRRHHHPQLRRRHPWRAHPRRPHHRGRRHGRPRAAPRG
jgi:hypothetical protein